jgi:hypothetical protein
MNIGGMGSENPSWSVFVAAAVPGTIGCGLRALCGKYMWHKRSRSWQRLKGFPVEIGEFRRQWQYGDANNEVDIETIEFPTCGR